MKRERLFRVSVIVLSIFLVAKIGLAKKDDVKDLYEHIQLFSDAMTYVRSNYVDEMKDKDLVYGALKGMLASLDPYSQFMDPESFKEIQIETKGEFGALGIEISIKDGLLTIISPLEDTPADKAGIKAGDRIVKIEDVTTKDITLIEAVKKLRGKPGSEVTITILRESESKIFDVKVTRAIIKMDSIKEASIIEDGIGYIRLVEFQQRTPQDLRSSLKKLKESGMESLILDLRNNPGGLLDVAVDVSDNFLKKDQTIVSTRGRHKEQEIVYRSRIDSDVSYPIVVMVNGGSASASEIVAGAIQDNRRGIVLGTKSFGKASVQTVIPLKDSSALRLTTAKYFTPSGRSIREEGIMPDVTVEYKEMPKTDEEEDRVEEVFEKVEKEKKEKKREYDNQLLRAVDLLKGVSAFKRMENVQKIDE
ncbi:MAG: S41 family peptidase [Candidatus Omnitrophota bacterium]